jgi:response regulator RpfG family c-di-GMP phosphodiesterase
MSGPTSFSQYETGERHWRLTAALLESPIGSTASLEVLVARLYRRDPDSLAHLHRVAAGARRIGDEMGLVGHELDDVEHAALIHDLGRIILPDWSESSADNREKSVMRRRSRQVQICYELTKDIQFLSRAAEIVATSLEFFDGTGLPIGRRGREIPVGARVLAVADVLDALTSVCMALSYSQDSATAEIVKQAGSRFDPEVVAACLRCSAEPPAPKLLPWWTSLHQRTT